jgi:hypothetical protein
MLHWDVYVNSVVHTVVKDIAISVSCMVCCEHIEPVSMQQTIGQFIKVGVFPQIYLAEWMGQVVR